MVTEVAVTGMGWSTALGNDLSEVWRRLLNGETGITPVESSYQLRNVLAASIQSAEKNEAPSDRLYSMTKSCILQALNDAQLSGQDKKNILIVGTSFGARLDDEQESNKMLHQWVDRLADELDLTPIALSTACSSASDAILMGLALIRSGYADTCICGGADILGETKRLAHSALGTMSPTSIRTFDQARDGTILGEGAGFIVLEKYKPHDNKKKYALLMGAGSANDASGLAAPEKEGVGIKLAVARSLKDANLQAQDIQIINAHGTGTPTNDSTEVKAYEDIFADVSPIVFATKGAFGHSLGATGALEAITTILALYHNNVPPIKNLIQSVYSPFLCFAMTPYPNHDATYGLSLTIGFGGFNTSLIFSKAPT